MQIGNESVRIDVLRERVRQLIEPRSSKEVFLRADGAVTVQQVMEVMDRLKEGGVEKVGMVTQPASSAAPAAAAAGDAGADRICTTLFLKRSTAAAANLRATCRG